MKRCRPLAIVIVALAAAFNLAQAPDSARPIEMAKNAVGRFQ
jgi:hypothetical protein